MELQRYQQSHRDALHAYWRRMGAGIPYFFPVSPERWEQCLLDDELGGERLFAETETWLALERGQVLGFAQYGRPNLAWDSSGERHTTPGIGVMRHFYFDKTRLDAAEALSVRASAYLGRFPQGHAFYHALGMSCNAYHGKLHTSLGHVDAFLLRNGFRVEHENVYYTLQITAAEEPVWRGLELADRSGSPASLREYAILVRGQRIGSLQVRLLEALTGGCTRDAAYLTWMGIHEPFRGLGWGAQTLRLLAATLWRNGYRHLHTDTASPNRGAQRFYERLGFQDRGRTRSYVQVRE